MTQIRIAVCEDAESILKIYSPFVVNSDVTFECVVPSVEEMQTRIKTTLKIFPWLVFESPEKDEVLGYAYAHSHGERAGYNWTAEVSVYVAEGHRRQKIGSKLSEKLLEILQSQGYYKIIARMADKNVGSQRLHQKLGYSKNTTIRNFAYKLGEWIDEQFWEKDLQQTFVKNPVAPVPFSEWIDLNEGL